jgi:small subunit ribosomal protein S20
VAHSLSAKKRVRQNAKRRLLNRDRKREIRLELKKIQSVITAGDKKSAAEELKKAQKTIDRISVRGGIHKKTAARRKSRLAKQVNALNAKK